MSVHSNKQLSTTLQGSDANLAGAGVKLSCGDWKLDTTDASEQQLTVTELQIYNIYDIYDIYNIIYAGDGDCEPPELRGEHQQERRGHHQGVRLLHLRAGQALASLSAQHQCEQT